MKINYFLVFFLFFVCLLRNYEICNARFAHCMRTTIFYVPFSFSNWTHYTRWTRTNVKSFTSKAKPTTVTTRMAKNVAENLYYYYVLWCYVLENNLLSAAWSRWFVVYMMYACALVIVLAKCEHSSLCVVHIRMRLPRIWCEHHEHSPLFRSFAASDSRSPIPFACFCACHFFFWFCWCASFCIRHLLIAVLSTKNNIFIS